MQLTSIDVKFIFDSVCLSASLGDKGLFSSANTLQIEANSCSCCFFSQKFAYFFIVKRIKGFAILYQYQNKSTSSPGFLD